MKFEEQLKQFKESLNFPKNFGVSDYNDLMKEIKKIIIEKALNSELDYHLEEETASNSRNGYSSKTIQTEAGKIELSTPRDRNSSFEPVIVKKGQRKASILDDQILALYARGMSTRDIVSTFEEIYGVEVSPALISRVTENVMESILEWQNRPLDPVYPIIFLDCIVIKVNQDKRVINKSVYLALAINMEGKKELLGMWISENEGSKFWLQVLTEIQTRGVKDIYIASVDGLKGFPEAINTVFPKTKIQLCIVHMVRNSLKYVSCKDYKAVTADLKNIYKSVTAEEAYMELDRFADKWDNKYPTISRMWKNNWENISTLFAYPDEIRRVIYTTNAIESLNSVIRKAVNNKKIFPDDQAAFKAVFLAIKQASKKWTVPIRNWKPALNRFEMEYGN